MQSNSKNTFEDTFQYRIYYKDTDAGGVVYHSRYLEFMEMARTDYLIGIGLPPQHLTNLYQIISPVIHLNIDYLKPSFYNDLLKVKIELVKITRLKIEFNYQFFREENQLVVKANTVNCFIKKSSDNQLKPTRIPQEILNQIKNAPSKPI